MVTVFERNVNMFTANVIENYDDYIVQVRNKEGITIPCFARVDTNSDVGSMFMRYDRITKKQAKLQIQKMVKKQMKQNKVKLTKRDERDLVRRRVLRLTSELKLDQGKEKAIAYAETMPLDALEEEDMLDYCWKNSIYGINGKRMTQEELNDFQDEDEELVDEDVEDVSDIEL